MSNPLSFLYGKWIERRRGRAEAMLEALKVKYHSFRILLANNEYSLDLLRSLDQALHSRNSSPRDFSEQIDELLSVCYELVDGLNRLSGGGYKSLYEKHHRLESAIREELDRLIASVASGPLCIFFDDISLEHHKSLVGGKAGVLAHLRHAGLPVPDGFAVTVKACEEILSTDGLDDLIRRTMRRAESGNLNSLELEESAAEIARRVEAVALPREIEQELRAAWARLTGEGSEAVSVRSSALVEDRVEHSFAGQFKSILNVASFEGFVEALKEVVAGAYSARAVTYRLHADLPLTGWDIALFCQKMVPARAAGVLFTLDPGSPENGRMLLSAVPGLGVLAVSGSAPADLYRPLREFAGEESVPEFAQIAAKTHRAVGKEAGGIVTEPVPEHESLLPVLSGEDISELVRLGRMIESLLGKPQNIEWAMSADGKIFILQSREIRLSAKARHSAEQVSGEVALKGGICASQGRSVGRVRLINSVHDFGQRREKQPGPEIMVLRQSFVDAARWLPDFEGVIVDLGNPADHLSCVAREFSLPMLTGIGKATRVLQEGQWIVLDADRAMIFKAPEEIWSGFSAGDQKRTTPRTTKLEDSSGPPAVSEGPPESAKLRELIEPLNLTDAYGPTFSILECKSLHDIVRFTHEMAVLSMFRLGDAVLEDAGMLVHVLSDGLPLHFLIIDLGGGLSPGVSGMKIRTGDVVSAPLLALVQGIMTPGLRWNEPAPESNISGLFSRAMLDSGGSRPVGQQNYALISRDYLNLNARVDFHFAMVDSVCGINPSENYIRFRFKGGGTTQVQRERRAQFIAEVLKGYDFFTDQQGDLVTATILEMEKEEIKQRLTMLGRLMGFSRLLDASMSDDSMPRRVAQAFLEGDYGLANLKEELAGGE